MRRNNLVRFQLTDTLDNSCNISTSGTNWVVSLGDPTGACATPLADPANPTPPAPAIIQLRSGKEGSKNAQVSTPQAAIVFNGLGRVTPVPAGDINFSVSNPVGGNCATLGGQLHCLRINVSPAGQVRMCDPMFPTADPKGCPVCAGCPF